jgi:tripartite-type tricarboxylate transporter receptor subunit TctC
MFTKKITQAIKMATCGALVFAAAPFALAQSAANFPDRTLTYVITVPPGGAADFVGRTLASSLAEEVKQPVMVDNRAGASGTIATAYVARAKPDGYTILQGAISTHGIGPYFFDNLTYDPFKDLMSLGLIAEFPLILAVKTDLPVTSVKELVELAKKSPGALKFASAGMGSAPHLTAEIFMTEAGINMLHVPYKGSAPAVRDILAGEVDIMFDGLPSLAAGLRSGRLRAIAAVSTTRNAAYPDLPTFTELGFPKMVASLWYIPMVPSETPKAIVDKLNVALVKSMKGTEAEKRLEMGGANLTYTTPDQTQAYIKADFERWGPVIKAAGVPTKR